MAIPYPCPICGGAGRIDGPGDVYFDGDQSSGVSCHACNGKGIVWESPEPYVVRQPVLQYDVHVS